MEYVGKWRQQIRKQHKQDGERERESAVLEKQKYSNAVHVLKQFVTWDSKIYPRVLRQKILPRKNKVEKKTTTAKTARGMNKKLKLKNNAKSLRI